MGARKVKLGRVSDVDLRLLRIFKVVAESGGLAAAEVALGIGRSTISTHLADLETRLGARLCDRGRSGFALTASGMKVFTALQGLMHSLDEFQQQMATLHGELSGDLHVGMVDNLVWDKKFSLADTFSAFAAVGEGVNLTVHVLSPDEIEKRLVDGAIHIAISPIMIHNPALHYDVIFDETSYLYCGRGHPLFDKPDDDIDDAALADCSYVRKGYSVDPEFREKNDMLRYHVSAFHVEAIAVLILSGAHIGFLPESYAANWVADGKLRAIRPSEWRAVFRFGAITRKNRTLTAVQEAFIRCLFDAVKQEGEEASGKVRAEAHRSRR